LDDCGSLRQNAISYIRPVKDIPVLDRKADKETRGFCHHTTARLLCPRHLQDKFDKDRETFCHDVHNGDCAITHNEWPSFLYPEDDYNPNEMDKKLLQSPFLVSVSRSIIFAYAWLIFL